MYLWFFYKIKQILSNIRGNYDNWSKVKLTGANQGLYPR